MSDALEDADAHARAQLHRAGAWTDARLKDYQIYLSITVSRDGMPVELTQMNWVQHGLSNFTDALAGKLYEIYGAHLDREPIKLWKRRVQVLRGSLSYHSGRHGTFRLPVTIAGESGYVRVVAHRLPLEQNEQ